MKNPFDYIRELLKPGACILIIAVFLLMGCGKKAMPKPPPEPGSQIQPAETGAEG